LKEAKIPSDKIGLKTNNDLISLFVSLDAIPLKW